MPRKIRKPSSRTRHTINGLAFKELSRTVYHRRKLAEGPVTAAQFERILESARWTPSVANKQPWLLLGSNGEEARELLKRLAEFPRSFADFFASSSEESATEDLQAAGAMVLMLGQRTCPFWRECCLLATHQLLFAAAAEGLAARALIPSSPNALAEIVRVPEEYLAFMLILLGREGDAEISTRMLKPVTEVSVPLSTRIYPKPDGR